MPWKVLASPDYFHFNPIPDLVVMASASFPHIDSGGANSQMLKPEDSIMGTINDENMKSELPLCRVLVDWQL
jgi:hypothetical protein